MRKSILDVNDEIPFKNCTLTYGHFNSVHHGHIRYLKHAASRGNKLIVAILPDTSKGSKNLYQFNQKERAESLSSFNFIDGIILLDDEENSLLNVIKKIEPNLLVLGKEFEKSRNSEIVKAIEFMRKQNKLVQFHAGDIHYASTQLLENSKNDLLEENKKKFNEACKRQGINLNQLLEYIESWKETNLLVVGDTILDQYAGCEAIGMSAEAPVLVVRELQKKNYVGGASVVASHIKALGANCFFLSVLGKDDEAKIIKTKLLEQNIFCEFIEDTSRHTTFKKRYLVENQKLFRVSKLNDHILDRDIEDELIKKIEILAPKVNGIVVSDFVYGVITEKLINKILSLSEKYKLKIFGDTQCSSQIGLVTKFKKFSLICPNEKEARIALQDNVSGLESLSHKLMSSTKSEKLIMKLGAQGFIAYDQISKGKYQSQSFPTLSVNPLDVSGAGDSLLSVMSTGLSSNNDFMSSAALACCMSAIAVENMGNMPIHSNQLKDFLKNSLFN